MGVGGAGTQVPDRYPLPNSCVEQNFGKFEGRSTPFWAKKRAVNINTKNTIGAEKYKLCLFLPYFVKFIIFIVLKVL